MKLRTEEEVIFSCILVLDGRIPDGKLSMDANCFNEIQNSMNHDIFSRHYGGSNRLDRSKSCCHHSLRDLCIHTDGTLLKLKKHCHWKGISNYSDGCIICLKSFSVGCISAVNKCTHIMQQRKRNKCMVCSIQVIFIFWSRFITQFVLVCCTSHRILLGSRCHMPITPSKESYCFKDQLLFHWHYIFHSHFFKATGPSVLS